MATHTPAESNRLAALRLIAAGKPLDGVHPSTLRSLERLKLAEQKNGRWRLLMDGDLLLAETAGVFALQYRAVDKWKPVLQRAGTEARYTSEAEAETAASTMSIVNLYPVRVVNTGEPEPQAYIVFDFGRRYLEQADGVRVADPVAIQLTDGEDNGGVFFQYVVQKRLRHWTSQGAFLPWASARPTGYVDLQDALTAARDAAAGDTDAYEYRVSLSDVPALPPVVFSQGLEMPDLGVLDSLAEIAQVGREYRVTAGRERRACAIGYMLADWAMRDVELVLAALRVAGDTTSEAAELEPDEFYNRL